MKIDLVIAGAIIRNESMIEEAINSCPSYKYNNKYILFDGLSKLRNYDERAKYEDYKNFIKDKYSEFVVIEFEYCIYFRNMIQQFAKISDGDKMLVVQDDVVLPHFDLESVVNLTNSLPDCKILSFPHKVIDKDTHWFEIIESMDNAVKTHGWSERAFICERLHILDICDNMPNNNRMNNKFIEYIYQTMMRSVKWKRMSDAQKLNYWSKFGCYITNDIIHKHLVGKRKIF